MAASLFDKVCSHAKIFRQPNRQLHLLKNKGSYTGNHAATHSYLKKKKKIACCLKMRATGYNWLQTIAFAGSRSLLLEQAIVAYCLKMKAIVAAWKWTSASYPWHEPLWPITQASSGSKIGFNLSLVLGPLSLLEFFMGYSSQGQFENPKHNHLIW